MEPSVDSLPGGFRHALRVGIQQKGALPRAEATHYLLFIASENITVG
jgi:hypothetical protein